MKISNYKAEKTKNRFNKGIDFDHSVTFNCGDKIKVGDILEDMHGNEYYAIKSENGVVKCLPVAVGVIPPQELTEINLK